MNDIAKHIEHTILTPDCSIQDVKRVCDEALKHGFAGVCIPPLYVRDARRMLGDDGRVRVVTVVGFPMGYSAIAAKSEEIKRACDEGADDIDAVLNIAAAKSGNWNHVNNDIDSMARAIHMRGRTMKLILECGLLTADEISQAIAAADLVGCAFMKTGTGFHGHPATVEMVRQLRSLTPAHIKIKAAGGIRTRELAEALIAAGAERIGTSVGGSLV